jgi:hypothetical protein
MILHCGIFVFQEIRIANPRVRELSSLGIPNGKCIFRSELSLPNNK